jgi:hypothetical protein
MRKLRASLTNPKIDQQNKDFKQQHKHLTGVVRVPLSRDEIEHSKLLGYKQD